MKSLMNQINDSRTINAVALFAQLVRLVVQTKSAFIALSGYNSTTGDDLTDVFAFDLRQNGYNVVEGNGSYKGAKEPSLFVLPRNEDGTFDANNIAWILSLAKGYAQESILVNNEAGAFFVYTDYEKQPEVAGFNFLVGSEAKEQDFYSDFAGTQFSVV